MTNHNSSYPADSYLSATGPIRYTFTNDYMFKINFQKRQVLSAFLCSLLRLTPNEIRDIEVTNPIEIGDNIDQKTLILDINLRLNNNALINLELQVENQHDWPDRSLSYGCRSFDQLYHGENYKDTLRVLHISILDFTLFPECPEFYATYKLLNVKNHHIYNDKFQLNVLELKSDTSSN